MFEKFNAENLSHKCDELRELLAQNNAEIERLIAEENYTYRSFVRPMQELDEKLTCFFTPIAIVQHTKNSEETQSAYNEMLPLLSEYETALSQNEQIYAAYKNILATDQTIDNTQKKVLTDSITDFELQGVGQNDKIKARIKDINSRLSDIDNQFSQNILDATKAYELIIDDPSDVAGIGQTDLAAFAIENSKWRFSLLPNSYHTYMTYGTNRNLRENMYKAYTTRASENELIIEEMLALKDEKAKLLGYKNYAEYSLKTKMAESADEVEKFILNLIAFSKKQANNELNELREFAAKNGLSDQLASYDIAFYSKQLEKQTFDYDEEQYKPYFEAEQVTSGLFDFLSKLFDITFVQIDAPKWDNTVRVFDIKSGEKVFARLYADLFERVEKRGGAWMDNWQTRMVDHLDNLRYPSAYIACNFPAPNSTMPSLLRHDDIVTLFHEMGHAIHHLLSNVSERDVSGISGVEWDAVEFPSQWLENFAYEPQVLKLFAKHYQNGETISDQMITKLINAKNFMSASAMLRQCEFALFDLRIHKNAYNKQQVQAILDDIRKTTSLVLPPLYNKFQNSFSHIFGGGYSAGYYSYKWAEVLSADAYYAFVDAGIFDKQTAQQFREAVLSAGGSRSALQNFTAFMHRKPDSNALLKLSGIA